jgi:predicted phosphoribosyltransferase
MVGFLFRDRRQAGEVLADLLGEYGGRAEVTVLALPRGGVPVGYEVAAALGVPLGVFLVRKLGVPGQPELALGAIASGGVSVLNGEVIGSLGIDPETVRAVAEREATELARREERYRAGLPPVSLAGRVAILVDDGLATGASMRAAVVALRELHPARIVVAVPVAAEGSLAELEKLADEVVCAETPSPFGAVGSAYQDFTQVTDREARELLAASTGQGSGDSAGSDG